MTLLPHDVHNATLVSHVHPAEWLNPAPAGRYNLVVIGAGTAGLIAASGAAGLGAKVALVERDLMGGDCLNVGCVPSKALLRAARAAADVRNAGEFGVRVPEGTVVDFPAVMERMRRLRVEISPNDSAARYRSLGVDVFFGNAQFTGPNEISVGDSRLRFRSAVIATGARAALPEIPGLSDVGCLTNVTVFSLTELPRRLAVLGGGPIGCELAQAFARFGSAVTLIHRHSHLLPRDDVAAAELVESSLSRDGVQLLLNAQVTSVSREGGEKILHLQQDDAGHNVRADEILVGVGRAPNVTDLNLEAAGIVYDEKTGVHVNDRLQTTNSRVFAAGDVCSRFQYTHAADAMARVVLQNALFLGRAKASALTIPHCTYTDPEVAHVGLTADEARERGIAVQTFTQELAHVDRAILDSETDGFVTVNVAAGSDRIVGATVVARHAGEIISELTLAMVGKIGLKTIARTIHPYPTQAEAIKRIADAWNRTRLTPFVKRLFEKWFTWRR